MTEYIIPQFLPQSRSTAIERLLFLVFFILKLLPHEYGFTSIQTILIVPLLGIFIKRRMYLYITVNPVLLFITLYYLLFTIVTFYYGNGDMHFLLARLKIVLPLYFAVHYYYEDREMLYKYSWLSIVLMCFANSALIFLFPTGWIINTIEVNQWYSYDSSRWFLGGANNMFYWYFLLIVLSYVRADINPTKYNKFLFIGACVISAIGFFIVNSDTSLASIALLSLCMIFVRKIEKKWNARIIIFALILSSIVLMQDLPIFSSITQSLFNKDSTFSNRTIVWMQSFTHIQENPLFGMGWISNEAASEMYGETEYVNAHNQVLQTLVDGGVALLFLFIMIFVSIIKKLNTYERRNVEIVTALIIILHMSFEVDISFQWCYSLLLIYFGFSKSKYYF